MPFFDERGGDLVLDAGVVGVELFQPVPHRQGLFRLLRALVDAAEGLEDVEQVGAVRLAGERPLERLGGGVRLADEHQGLPEVVGRDRVVGQGRLRLAEGGDGGGVTAALALEQADNHPGDAVFRVLLCARRVLGDQLVEQAALDVIAVEAVEGGAAARVRLEHLAEAGGDGLFLRLLR